MSSKLHKKGKNRVLKRTVAVALSGMMAMSPLMYVRADDTLPYKGEAAKGENQPYQHGYRAEDIMNWSPKTDPDAEMLRAKVPLQNRNAAFADTQANPKLSTKPQYFTLTGDYGNAFFDSYPYTNEFSQHEFNFWQYVDYYGSWHGMPSVGVPEKLYNAEGERNGTSDWQQRTFEFGLVNLPNPAYTNAAHKNGVKSIGCIFQPRAYQNFEVMLYKDDKGRYPVADKLSEMAKYYGFDGWFFNMEGRQYSAETAGKLQEFFGQMKEDGMYIQWYSASSSFNESTAKYLSSGEGKGADRGQSVFLDYGWSDLGSDSNKSILNKYGLDTTTTLFGGVEAGGNKFSNNFDKFVNSDGSIGSIASLGTDFVQTALRDSGLSGTADKGPGYPGEMDQYQWMAFDRERMWWSGGNQNPAKPEAKADPDVLVDSSNMKGVANYIAERSVVSGDEFETDFNTGHGMNYYKNGEISNDKEWSNINIQSTLPTWQWWFDGTDKLKADFDYGNELKKTKKDKTEGTWDYSQIGGYEGGSSLVVYGDTTPKEGQKNSFLHLYKTEINLGTSSDFDIAYDKTSDDAVSMKLGLIFKDDPSNVVTVDIPKTEEKTTGWTTANVDLSQYAGKTVAAFGLVFEGTSSSYQMNIGQMRFNDKKDDKPETPANLHVEKVYGNTDETVLDWDLADYDKVKQYNVYAEINGKDVYMGGIYDNTYYIKDTYGAKDITYKVKAVSKDGTESDAAQVEVNYNDVPKDIKVDNSTDGSLKLTWNGGQADVTVSTTTDSKVSTWTGSGNGSCDIKVPTGKDADGRAVTVKVTGKNGSSCIDTTLPDKYCADYDGKIWTDGRLIQPSQTDWYKIYTAELVDGKRANETSYTRGTKSHSELNNDWSMFQPISGEAAGIYVTVEDYNGNKSNEVYIPYREVVVITGADETSIYPDYEVQLSGKVYGAKSDDSVVWSISGQKSNDTKISQNGKFTVSKYETAESITVKATSKEDENYSKEITFTLKPAMAVSTADKTVEAGKTTKVTVNFKGKDVPAEDYDLTLERADQKDGTLKSGTKIASDGTITIDKNEIADSIRVTATQKADKNYKASCEFNYKGNLVYEITVDPAKADVKKGESKQFTATVSGYKAGDKSKDYAAVTDGITVTSKAGFSDYSWYGTPEDLLKGDIDKTAGCNAANATVTFKTDKAVKLLKWETAATNPYAKWGDKYDGPTHTELFASTDDGKNWVSLGKLDNFMPNADGSKNVGTVNIASPMEASLYKIEYTVPANDWGGFGSAAAVVLYKAGWGASVSQNVVWSVEGNKSSDTSISSSGVLTVAKDEPEGNIKVRATSVSDPAFSNVAEVAVKSNEIVEERDYHGHIGGRLIGLTYDSHVRIVKSPDGKHVKSVKINISYKYHFFSKNKTGNIELNFSSLNNSLLKKLLQKGDQKIFLKLFRGYNL